MPFQPSEPEDPVDRSSQQPMLRGTMQVFLAEGLLLPTGLVTAAFLTRRLGPDGYGLFALVSVLIAWIQWSVSSVLSRTTITLVGEAQDWRPVATVILRFHLVLSCSAAALILALADLIARSLEEPQLAFYLRLLAIDIPILSLAHAHRDLLVGLGNFRARALASALRWIARMVLIVLFLELGFSIGGAILGVIGASVVELSVSRFYVQPSLFARSSFPLRSILRYAAPLSLFALSMRLFDRVDLFLLQVLGESARDVGVYAAAQNLSSLPGILALSFSPLLLSTLTRSLRDDRLELARDTARHAMRAVICLLPFAAMTAASADEVVTLLYGSEFRASAGPLGVLMLGSVVLLFFWTTTAVVTADGRPRLTLGLALPILPLALLGHFLAIPRWGPMGAAWVTTTAVSSGTLCASLVVYRIWRIAPPIATLIRSLVVTAIAFWLASLPTPGSATLVAKLIGVSVVIVAGFFVLGEVTAEDRAAGWRALRHRGPDRL